MAARGAMWNPEMESLSPDDFRRVQEKALKKQWDYVWENSPFYRDKYTRAGLTPGDLNSLDDLAKLPFTEKQELRDSLKAARPLGRHAAVGMDRVARVYSTSGTTGDPTYIGLTAEDREVWAESARRAMWACGMRPEHVVPLPIGTFFIAASYGEAIEGLGSTLVPVGVGATDRFIAACHNLSADFVLSTTSFPLHLLDYCQKKGLDPASLGIRGFMLGGEPGAGNPQIRQRIESGFGAVVRECMGNGDMVGLMWAECDQGGGMHFIAQEACHPEIIDPDTGESLEIKTGVRGELVYTSLNRCCQPLIRFRTRDHVEITGTECSCGRTGFKLVCIGRTDDMLIVSGVNVYPSAVREVVGALAPRVSGEIQIVLTQEPPAVTPPLQLKVEAGPRAGDRETLARDVAAILREKLIFSAKVTVVDPGSLPKFAYKAKLVEKSY